MSTFSTEELHQLMQIKGFPKVREEPTSAAADEDAEEQEQGVEL